MYLTRNQLNAIFTEVEFVIRSENVPSFGLDKKAFKSNSYRMRQHQNVRVTSLVYTCRLPKAIALQL